MRKINRFISLFLTVCILSASVFLSGTIMAFAEETTTTQNITTKDDLIDNINSDTDNSEIDVRVVKQNGDEQTTIFTGKLKDYDNGKWISIDFSDIQFFVLLDWDSMESEAVYIVPLSKNTEIENNTDVSKPSDESVNETLSSGTALASQNNSIQCDVNLMYDGTYSEKLIIRNKQLTVPVKITNNGSADKNIVCYIAEYDENGVLRNTISGSAVTVEAGKSIATQVTKVFSSETKSVKIFVWDSESLQPITGAIILDENESDYYANSATEAQEYDIDYQIKGKINTASDVDYIKFVPKTSGKYTFNCVSATNAVTTLYNSNQGTLKSASSSYKYSLTENQTYYLKVTGNIGEYVLSVQYNVPSEADSFSIYDFDVDTNVYKKSALNICDDLYYENIELSKQMYSEYEDILNEEAKLHKLPDFLSEHPKELENFDDIVNQYYSTKYSSLSGVRQKYIDLIDKYTDTLNIASENGANAADTTDNTTSDEYPIIGKYYPEIYSAENIEEPDETESAVEQRSTAALTITGTTSTSITYNVTFPSSGSKGNAIYLVNFNNSNGLTTEYNVYGSREIYRKNGEYTISGLQPGGIYILEMLWSTDGGKNYGGENSIDRFVQLPCNTIENLQMYENDGRVSAYLEPEDKELASDSDFDTWLDRMDKAYNSFRELTGYTPYNSQKIVMQSTRDNLNDSFDTVDGKNYWWVIFGYYDYTRIFKHSKAFNQGHMRRLSQGDWGDTPMHELSHVFDYDSWVFDSETLAQFKLYYVVSVLNAKIYRPDRFNNNGNGWYTGSNYYTLLKTDRYMDSYTNSFDKGNYASEGFAAILIEIQKKIGWEPFKKTFRYFSDLAYDQVPYENGEKLKLFLTKLKDYSGKDVLSYISTRDKNIINSYYDTTLEYVVPAIPITSGGDSAIVSADKGSYAVYTFTPSSSGNYYVYTSPYAGSGISNDTYIEVYTDSAMSNMIDSNDDYGGSRFSKVNIAMTKGNTYYIKVRHYKNGQLLSKINISKNVPTEAIAVGGYADVTVSYGDYSMYMFTPEISGAYVFEVTGYNGGNLDYDTYIKLYESESMSNCIGNDNTRIIANLKAGHTYYLQFSGFLMKYARGRINLSQGQTLQFTKRSDSSFIYVNSPEYITEYDILDDTIHEDSENNPYRKLFEQENVTGKNTFYETHTAWWDENKGLPNYKPSYDFYMDIDMYNPTNQQIIVSIENLAYGVSYDIMQQYYSGGLTYDIPIEPYSHVPILSYLGAPLLCTNPNGTAWARIPVILFDFTVKSGNITVSSLAAYNPANLYLRNGTKNIVNATGAELDTGEIIIETDSSGNPCWGNSPYNPRPNESDLYAKQKGIARNQSAWIDAELDLVIDENTQLGNLQPIILKDNFYTYGIANPKWHWMSSISPTNDKWQGVLMALPESLHSFTYHYQDTNRVWNFDFLHRDLRFVDMNGTRLSINDSVSDETIENMKQDMASGQKNHFAADEAPDEYSISIGEWGATYHYTITATNTTDNDRTVLVQIWSAENMTFGIKETKDAQYTTAFYCKIPNTPASPKTTASVTIPKNTTKTFEFVTNLGGGQGGISHGIVIE